MSKNKEEHLKSQGLSPEFWFMVVVPAVLKRDNYSCQSCGSKKRLHVHHKIKGVQVFNNLITLCASCHMKLHHYKIPCTDN